MTVVRGKPPESPTFSVHELAAGFGITPHLVRKYVKRGLLPPPRGWGRGAHYTAVHWQRMKQIRAAVEANATLDEIKDRLR